MKTTPKVLLTTDYPRYTKYKQKYQIVFINTDGKLKTLTFKSFNNACNRYNDIKLWSEYAEFRQTQWLRTNTGVIIRKEVFVIDYTIN